MLLFSTVLSVKDTLTKESFIQLVFDWNRNTPHEENIIPGLEWNGETEIRYENGISSLEVRALSDTDVTAVRYEKADADGAIWDSDFVLNLQEKKIGIQLFRSFRDDASIIDTGFTAPYFVKMLSDGGFLADDDGLETTCRPHSVDGTNLGLASDVINGSTRYKLPVAFVSPRFDGQYPLDTERLASKLKGIAHVLVLTDPACIGQLRELCDGKNEYNGAVGVYYPIAGMEHQRFYHANPNSNPSFLMNKIVRAVTQYAASQHVAPAFTWDGVKNAQLGERLKAKISEVKQEQEEKNGLLEIVDEEMDALKRRIDELTAKNLRLERENYGLKAKMQNADALPVIHFGDEEELFPGEIKDIVLSVLIEKLKNIESIDCRRTDVLRDLVQSNEYRKILEGRAARLKTELAGYTTMSPRLKSFLSEIGIEIVSEKNHYKLVYFNDNRYAHTLPKTASDRGHGDKNAVSEIINKML